MTSSPAIEINALRKTYRAGFLRRKGFEALRGVSLAVQPGQIFGLLGPNGAGKTTVIKVLLGIIRKSSGQARLLGHPAGDRASRQQVGYLPENLHISPYHTASSAMKFYGQLSGLSAAASRRRRDELLEMVELRQWSGIRLKKFSKGMLQRLGLAQALLHDPQLLILDEPTDGLDPVGRNSVRELLLQLKAAGKTIFLNSHLLQEVELVCDQVAIMDRGDLCYVGSVDEVCRHRVTEEVQFELAAPQSEVRAALDHYAQVRWEATGENRYRVVVGLADQAALDDCVDNLRQHGVSILSIAHKKATLEDAFLEIILSARGKADS